jgi:hypothetical protein
MKKWIAVFLITGVIETVSGFFFFSEAAWWLWVNGREILVLDFIGFNDHGKDHAWTFRQTMLPNAGFVSVGIHGVIPDAWRKRTGYDAIVRAGSAKDYEYSVDQVYRLVEHDQTILAFDFNEQVLPRQLRPTNKILHPAMVAAKVAERWRQEHPDGLVILRGHSDGTYAETYIFDYLKGKQMPPDAIILESPRQKYTRWAKRAEETPETLVLAVTSAGDLPREWPLGKGYDKAPSANWVNLHVKELRNPLSAHGIVTDYSNQELKVQRTDANGRSLTQNVSLGNLIQEELQSFFSRRKQEQQSSLPKPSSPPADDSRRKVGPIDPSDNGEDRSAGMGGSPPPPPPPPPGASGGGAASGLSSGSRGGISAEVQIRQEDFQAQ